MRKAIFFKIFFTVVLLAASAAAQTAQPDWSAKVTEAMPLLGHRNWILVVDSAYPLQISPGVETIETNASQLDVVRMVLSKINHSAHVSPSIYMDAELPYLTDAEVPGVSVYRMQVRELLHEYKIESMPHEKIISTIDEAGKTFRILVLKTNMTIPYTSVFIRLDCKYWTADQEKRLRTKMGQ